MPETQESFIPLYVDYIHKQAHLATASRDYSSLVLAAHLFAVAHQLSVDGFDLGKKADSFSRHVFRSPSHLETILSSLPDDRTPSQLYWRLIAALEYIENLNSEGRNTNFLSEPVEITTLTCDGRRALGGRVLCGIRPASAFRSWRLDEKHPPRRPKEEPGQHLRHLVCHWLRRQIRVSFAQADDDAAPLIRHSGKHFSQGEPFKIALCPLDIRAHPKFELVEDGQGFAAHEREPMISEPGYSVPDQLREILDACRKAGIHILVLPELTIDPMARSWLSEQLRKTPSDLPYAVVAGSFHTGSRPSRNECHFLNHIGETLLLHHKRGRFTITRRQAEELCKKGFFHDSEWILASLSALPDQIEEHIKPGDSIVLLETSLGQMTVLICADGIDDELGRPELHQEIASLRPDFVFLPSMSPKTSRFDELATQLERLGVSSFFVNAACICPPTETLAAFCIGIYEDADGPATRVRWRGEKLEQWARKPEPGGWTAIGDRGSAVSWLEGEDDSRIGLVVDLSAYRS